MSRFSVPRVIPGEVGSWLVLVAGARIALVQHADAGSEIGALWAAVDGADDAQAVLDHLTRTGLSRAPSFALVEAASTVEGDPRVRVIVRGGATVLLDSASGEVRLSGAEVSTWTERLVDRVTSVRVLAEPVAAGRGGSGAGVPDAALPLVGGAMWATAVSAELVAGPSTDAVAGPSTDAVAGPSTDAVAEPAGADAEPAVEAPVSAPALPGQPALTRPPTMPVPVVPPVSDLAAIDEATALPPVEDSVDEAAAAADADAAAADPLSDATVVVPRPAASGDPGPVAGLTAVSPSEGSIVDDTDGDHDGHTIVSGDLAELRRGRAEAGEQGSTRPPSEAGPAPVAPVLFLELSTGSVEYLSQPVVVGRAPSASKVSGGLVPRLVAIPGDQDISRNHARFAVEGDTVVVTDLHSRNGTMVALPGKQPQRLRQGEPTAVLVDTVVDLGNGITLTVRQDR